MKMIESLFIEIKNKNGSNAIVGVVYRHPSVEGKGEYCATIFTVSIATKTLKDEGQSPRTPQG